MPTVFIDGSAGTTGLRIRERLAERGDLEVLVLPDELRKDSAARKEMLDSADVAFLCLPDAAAREAVSLLSSPSTVIIDTSTAHRTAEGWTYGFPEIGGLREKIRESCRIANPGCHASGFIALVAPLVEKGLISTDTFLSAYSLTGYSGGGKKMIADYNERGDELLAPRVYGLGQSHKHLPEMEKICSLSRAPFFSPIVSSYYSGMEVVVSVPGESVKGGPDAIRELYSSYYRGGMVKYREGDDEGGFLSSSRLSGFDDMVVGVWGSGECIQLVSRFDNLGKGASGAAIQNMNLVLGLDERTGLSEMED